LQAIRARAEGLKRGLEAELSIAVDVVLPAPALVRVLETFAAEFPTVPLRLSVGAMGIVWQQLLTRQCDVSFGGQALNLSDELAAIRIGETMLIPVAAPDHPLAI
ncbi:LysR substrate-binding domain-containing protein, partial [Rhizobiaceae sp. 2RAB30]